MTTPAAPLCRCRFSDAWRCAVDQRLSGQISCHCSCHYPAPPSAGETREAEPRKKRPCGHTRETHLRMLQGLEAGACDWVPGEVTAEPAGGQEAPASHTGGLEGSACIACEGLPNDGSCPCHCHTPQPEPAPACICGQGPTASYEGELRDCPVHGEPEPAPAESRADRLRDALAAARDVLVTEQKEMGWLPQQQAWSTKMTAAELRIAEAVRSIDAILADDEPEPAPASVGGSPVSLLDSMTVEEMADAFMDEWKESADFDPNDSKKDADHRIWQAREANKEKHADLMLVLRAAYQRGLEAGKREQEALRKLLAGAVYCIEHHFADETVGGQPCDCDQALAARAAVRALAPEPPSPAPVGEKEK